MKTWLTQLLGVCAAVLVLSSCDKDEDRITLKTGDAPVLTSSATTATLSKADADKTAVTYTWTPLTFSWSTDAGAYAVPVTYTLQFDKQGNNFASPQEIVSTSTSAALKVSELNAIYSSLKLPNNTPATLDVRLRTAYSNNQTVMTSTTTSIRATPYESRELPKDTWSIIGPAGVNWDTDVPMTYDFDNQTFTVTTTLKADIFKFRSNGKWDLNYGDDGADGALEANGANIAAPSAGSYTITLNLNSKPKPTYTLKKN